MQSKLLILISILVLIGQIRSHIGCLSPQGKPVDWFIVLKAPKVVDPNGVKFDYMDSTNSKEFKQYSDIDSTESPIYQTVSQIKDLSDKSLVRVFWNDEEGDQVHGSQAHAKGIIGGDSTQAFVLEHSVPKFPTLSSGKVDLKLPDTGHKYGQHFFCVTMDINNLKAYSNALQIIRPYVFNFSNIPASLENSLPNLEFLMNNSKFVTTEQLIQPVKSLGGVSLTKFAKNRQYQVQLYANIVAPYYKVDLDIECWVNGSGGKQGPYCGTYNVLTVEKVQLSMGSFQTNQDHSKYGCSRSGNVVCFADLNRFDSQDKRGGGAFCFKNTAVWDNISQSFTQTQTCSSSLTFIEEKLNELSFS